MKSAITSVAVVQRKRGASNGTGWMAWDENGNGLTSDVGIGWAIKSPRVCIPVLPFRVWRPQRRRIGIAAKLRK